jgi:hypothetical protein
MTLDEALAKLRAAKPLLDRYGVAARGRVRLDGAGRGGSGQRRGRAGEYRPSVLPGFGFFRLERELVELLGRPVDLVTEDGLHRLVKEPVLREVVFA